MAEPNWPRIWHGLADLLGSKWSVHVLVVLAAGPRGFNELERALEDMTATMLSRRLKELRCHGLVDRTVEDTSPPTTTYRLTDSGSAFVAKLRELEDLVAVQTECHGDSGASAGDTTARAAPGATGEFPDGAGTADRSAATRQCADRDPGSCIVVRTPAR